MAEVNLQKIRDRIAKLLAKGENTACTVEEAEAFNAKAFALMQEYNIERSELSSVEAKIARTHRTLTVQKRPWSAFILHGLCNMYNCKWVFRAIGRTHEVTLIGEEAAVATCHAIAIMVLRAAQTEARRAGDGRSFLNGAGNRIYIRCMEMANPEVSGSRALIVLGEQDRLANEAYAKELFGHIAAAKKARTITIRDAESFSRGDRFGATVSLQSKQLR